MQFVSYLGGFCAIHLWAAQPSTNIDIRLTLDYQALAFQFDDLLTLCAITCHGLVSWVKNPDRGLSYQP